MLVQTMYTIKQAAVRTGLSVPTIRAWERRYGVVRPRRTAAGYRLYDDDAIARLAAMRRLVDGDGWRPSQAAERVLAAGDNTTLLAGLGREPERPATSGGDGAPGDGDLGTAHALADAFYAATRALDVRGMEQVLDDAFAGQRFEGAIRDVVFPALRAVGDGWATGEIDVAAEHAASETVRRRLSQLYEAAGPSLSRPTVLVGLPPGSHHEIGAFAFAVAARRSGLGVLYLGADVPLESWLRTARETAAPLVVLGVVTAADVASATLVAEGLRTLAAGPRCLLGGALARDVTATPGVDWLPDPLDEAVARLNEGVAPAN
jgi:MerR family transcriptional regulator, light-induced transcriptional regulator